MESGATAWEVRALANEYRGRYEYRSAILAEALELLAEKKEAARVALPSLTGDGACAEAVKVGREWVVECNYCVGEYHELTREAAIEGWNKRAPSHDSARPARMARAGS